MADIQQLKVIATAEVSGLTKGMETVQSSLAKTAAAAVKADSALAGINKGTGQATNALTNLNRVVQDAPYGFIGIANNLNPLLESFQRLRVEAGSNKAAIQSLLSSLIGGGGLGLALAAVTSAISFASLGFSMWSRGARSVSESNKELKSSIQDIASGVAKEYSEVSVLVESYKKENLTKQEKINIVKQLQQLAPGYFANLSAEKTSVDQLTTAYDAYVRSIGRAVEVKIREAQLNKVIERRIELQDKAAKTTNLEVDANGKLKKSYNAIFDEEAKGRNEGFRMQLLTKQEQIELNNLLRTEKDLIGQISNLKGPQDFIKNLRVKPEKIEIEKPKRLEWFEPGMIKAPEFKVPEAKMSFKSIDFQFPKELSDKINAGFEKFLKNIDAIKQIEAFSNLIENTINDMGTSLATAIGDVVADLATTGGSDIGNIFKGLMSSVGQQIQELGKFLIQAAIKVEAAKKAISTIIVNPIAKVAVGIGLLALGALIKQQAQKQFKGFASGTSALAQGGFYNVGERGPERVFLPAGASVQPNNEMRAFGGGDNGFIAFADINIDKFTLAIKRSLDKMNRAGSAPSFV